MINNISGVGNLITEFAINNHYRIYHLYIGIISSMINFDSKST